MSEYPTSPGIQQPLSIRQRWRTIVSAFDGGNEQRRQKGTFPRFDIVLQYQYLTVAEMMILWNFYLARAGMAAAFYFYCLDVEDCAGLYCGIGDGAEEIFDLPGKTTSDQAIYLAGVLQESGYTILTGGGAENSDRVEFDTHPVEGVVITCNFTGYQRIHCRFDKDDMTRERFTAALLQTGLTLVGVFP